MTTREFRNVWPLALLCTLLVSLWSWFWTTFPVNETVAASWSDTDWQHAANVAVLRGSLRAILLAVFIVWISGRTRRRDGSEARSLSIGLAVVSALIVFGVTWYASRDFLAVKALW